MRSSVGIGTMTESAGLRKLPASAFFLRFGARRPAGGRRLRPGTHRDERQDGWGSHFLMIARRFDVNSDRGPEVTPRVFIYCTALVQNRFLQSEIKGMPSYPNSGIGSVNYNLDGGSNTNGLRNTGNVAPNPDAVQEFRVTTSSYPADEGRFGGGTVTMITKSGTNELHGSLFEFVRNHKLNAHRWVPGGSNLTKDPLHRNQFGGTAGGPIIRNKTFVFGSYSGLRERTTIFKNDATPLNAVERTGDLSLSGGTSLIDPLTGRALTGRCGNARRRASSAPCRPASRLSGSWRAGRGPAEREADLRR